MKTLKAIVSKHLLWVSVAASLAAFLVARANGANLEAVVLAATVATLVAALLAERWLPHQTAPQRCANDNRTDLASAITLLGIADPLLKYLAPLAVVALYASLPGSPATLLGALLGALPFLVQLLVVTLLIEFGRYWAHRWHHSSRRLWWLHAMHHSSTRLRTVNNFRFHPLNYAINFSLSVLPLMLLGAPAELLLGYMAITQPVLMLQHANIDLRSGWANRVFSSNQLHRWHHSADSLDANSNFGNALVLWDQLFGTYKAAQNDQVPAKIGLFSASSHYPAQAGYFAQLLSMFKPGCCKA